MSFDAEAAALALMAAVNGVWLFHTVAGAAGAGVEDWGWPETKMLIGQFKSLIKKNCVKYSGEAKKFS